jgi:hypothetical protein
MLSLLRRNRARPLLRCAFCVFPTRCPSFVLSVIRWSVSVRRLRAGHHAPCLRTPHVMCRTPHAWIAKPLRQATRLTLLPEEPLLEDCLARDLSWPRRFSACRRDDLRTSTRSPKIRVPPNGQARPGRDARAGTGELRGRGGKHVCRPPRFNPSCPAYCCTRQSALANGKDALQ